MITAHPNYESSGEEEKAAGEGYGAVSLPAAELSQADLDWLKLGAHWMLAALPDSDPEALRVLIVQVNEIRKVMPKDVSADARARMEALRLHCRNVCDGKEKLDKRLMARTAMTTPAEIEPKAVSFERKAQGNG